MKTVLITGASRGIGRKTALKFAEEGFKVAINYNKSKKLAEQLCEEIIARGGIAGVFCADVADPAQVRKMVEDIKAQLGDVDVLVNNAGVALKQGLFTDFSEEEMKTVFETDIFGMMNCAREIIPGMVKKKRGCIINISSIWGVCGGSCEVIYSSAKAAVIGFTKALARELAPSGINVNCVAPGIIDTDMNGHLSKEEIDGFCEDVPIGRMGTTEEVAESIFFLSSEKASYINGQVINIDGGMI